MTSPKWRRPMYHKKNLPEGVNIVGVGIPKISNPGQLRVNDFGTIGFTL